MSARKAAATVEPETTTEPDLDALGARLEELAGVTSRMWDSAPDVGKARARAGRLSEATSALIAAVRPDVGLDQIIDSAIDRLLDGADLDVEDLRADIARATASTEAGETAARALQARSITCRMDIEAAERAHADVALGVLHETVVQLVDVTRPLIAGADAAPVTASDAGRGWQARGLLETAAGIHDAIRRAQQGLTDPSLSKQYGVVADVSGLSPWKGWLTLGQGGYSDAPAFVDLVERGGTDLLRLVADRSLEAWCPSRAALDAAAAAMRLRVEVARRTRANPDTGPQRDMSSGASVTIDGVRQTPSIPNRVLGSGARQRR